MGLQWERKKEPPLTDKLPAGELEYYYHEGVVKGVQTQLQHVLGVSRAHDRITKDRGEYKNLTGKSKPP